MRLYLSSLSPWNGTYSNIDGHHLFKVESPPTSEPRRLVTIYRALPDMSVPTSERQLWEERHYFETHPSSQRDHPEYDGQGSGLGQDDLIFEESRLPYIASDSDDSLYEYPLNASQRSRSPSSRTTHSDSHPFWVKEHWVHFADINYHTTSDTKFNVAGHEFEARDYFERDGVLTKSQSFTASDGKQYRWDLKGRYLKLYRIATQQDLSEPGVAGEELVVEFLPAFVSDPQRKKIIPPTLIINASVEPIVDLILVTFVFMELQKKDGTLAPENIILPKDVPVPARGIPASSNSSSEMSIPPPTSAATMQA